MRNKNHAHYDFWLAPRENYDGYRARPTLQGKKYDGYWAQPDLRER